MASINSIQIKSLKEFRGHEGEPLFQGNVYYKGKRLGFWTQDAHGAICDTYEFNEHILDEEVEKFAKSDMVEEWQRDVVSSDSLLVSLVELMDMEKQFKKFLKKGYDSTIVITDGYHYFYGACKETRKENVLKEFDGYIRECTEKCFKNKEVKTLVFTSLNDFNVVV